MTMTRPALHLVVVETEEAFAIDRSLLIGSSSSCDVVARGASLEHVRVDAENVEALASCVVGKVPLAAGQRRRVVPGSVIEVGETRLVVRRDADVHPPPSDIPTREMAFALVARAEADPSALAPTVEIVQGPHAGLRLPLKAGRTYRVGRETSCDLALVNDRGASRAHLEIELADGLVLVSDLNTTQGTRLGPDLIDPRRRAVWEPDTMVRIGENTVLALLVPASIQTTIEDYARACRASTAVPSDAGLESDVAPVSLSVVSQVTAAIAERPAAPAPLPPEVVRGDDRLVDGLVIVALGLVAVLSLAALVWVFVT